MSYSAAVAAVFAPRIFLNAEEVVRMGIKCYIIIEYER